MNIRWNSFFKINKVPNTLKHRRYGNFADNFFLSFAGFFGYTSDVFAAKPRRLQFSDSHTREHQYQNGIVALVMRIFLAKIDELFFFVFGKRAPLFDFIRIQNDFPHRVDKLRIILRDDIEHRSKKNFQLLRGAVFALIGKRKQVFLNLFAGEQIQRRFAELRN